MLATDALVSGGGELAKLSDKTVAELHGFLPRRGATATRWTSWATRTPSATRRPSR
ncbi:Acetyl-CoA synthetase [Archangium gephyra]|uniref:Acetyl-CoA synthetase n=1 Tax=Archangium gephyra TaxID=48 RepID=A0AAC8PZK6_9BACT|nr:Acetyl-CoA synthetase [Archangium gephyra]